MNLEHDEAKIINTGNYSIVIYKDTDSNIYAVSSISTHNGCEFVWNSVEQSWECPELDQDLVIDGKFIHGPTVHDLKSYLAKK